MKPKALTTRRRFFWKAGAALTAPLAAGTAGASGVAVEETEALAARLRLLEDVNAIRALNRDYARHVDAGEHEEAARLFADPANAAPTGRIRGLSLSHPDRDDIEFSADRTKAAVRMHCTVQIETPIEPRCPLVDMAVQQGGGVVKRSESGVLENVCVKRGDVWKIERSLYRSA